MRHLAYGARQSGKTYNFIMELPEEAENIYVVANTQGLAWIIKSEVAKIRSPELANKIRPIGLDSLDILRGLDPLDIFFEHTAYEYASASQLRLIYMIEERKDALWNGELE
jgi:hypothetical protein